MSIQRNSSRFRRKKPDAFSVEEYVNGIKNGDRTLLSKAITLVESAKPEYHELSEQIVEACLPLSGNSVRVGITGVPGVGKSTFIEAFGYYLAEEMERKVAVLAIDPSSKRSGGSILGDKTRMNQLSVHENAFIRPSPSSGALGGVARATRESIILCEAAGFDTIIVETVGVGQSETEVRSMVDFFLLLMLAGAGDELQGIKRGIMEMADCLVINKADGDNLKNAKLAKAEYQSALHLFPASESNWIPKVGLCSALNKEGIDAIWTIILDYVNLTKSSSYFEQLRANQAKFWLEQTINTELLQRFYNDEKHQTLLKELEGEVISGKISPFKAARKLLGN